MKSYLQQYHGDTQLILPPPPRPRHPDCRIRRSNERLIRYSAWVLMHSQNSQGIYDEKCSKYGLRNLQILSSLTFKGSARTTQMKTAVTAYLKSKQLLMFAFARQIYHRWSRPGFADPDSVRWSLSPRGNPGILTLAPHVQNPAILALCRSSWAFRGLLRRTLRHMLPSKRK